MVYILAKLNGSKHRSFEFADEANYLIPWPDSVDFKRKPSRWNKEESCRMAVWLRQYGVAKGSPDMFIDRSAAEVATTMLSHLESRKRKRSKV
jgi:hypothetical protein